MLAQQIKGSVAMEPDWKGKGTVALVRFLDPNKELRN
jgi:hypothetical protein